jgi:hypothetical protein
LGCSNVTDKASDLTTVSVGADTLSAVQIERSMALGPTRLPACLNLSITLPSSKTTVAMQSTDAGCSLSMTQPDLVLFDEPAIERARTQLGAFDVDGIRSGSVSVEKLQLSGADGASLSLSQYVDALSVQVDGQTLLDRTPASALQGDEPLTRRIPNPILEKLKTAVKSHQAATADVSLTLWLHGQTLTDLPGALKLLVVLQPQLEVSLLKAL